MRISQVLVNLLGNAVKYSGNDTDISLTVTEKEGEVKKQKVLQIILPKTMITMELECFCKNI